MEFEIGICDKNIEIEWNGPTEKLCRKVIITSLSKSHHMRVYLFYPKMPTNHVICLINRLKRVWLDKIGQSTEGASKALATLDKFIHEPELITDDSTLIGILEDLGLDDVATDLDLLAVRKWKSRERMNTNWAFGFSPDLLDHFLTNMKLNGELICYGRNGDEALL